jgi:hypothetical protein
MIEPDERFVLRAIRRKRLFLSLSIAGLAVAFALMVLYGLLWWRTPDYPTGLALSSSSCC